MDTSKATAYRRLIDQFMDGEINRVEFLRRFAASGLSLAVLPVSVREGLGVNRSAAGANGTLVVASTDTPKVLDIERIFTLPSLEANFNLYSLLFEFPTAPYGQGAFTHSFNKLLPSLAKSITASADGRTYTVKLNSGIMSDFGNQFDAYDVKWRWDRMWGLKAIGIIFYDVTTLTGPDSVTVVDPMTVRFHLPGPNSIFAGLMANNFLYYLDSKEAKKHATTSDPWALEWTQQNPCGYGPYTVEAWTPGQQISFKARPAFYGPAPKTKRVIMKAVPSAANRQALLESGAVDIAEYLTLQQLNQLKQVPGVTVDSWPANIIVGVEMNMTTPPFDNLVVRQAISYAVPYDAILKSVYFGLATPWKSCIPSVVPGYTSQYFPYSTNLSKAKQLLAQAGHAQGFSTTLSYNTTFPEHQTAAILIQQSLAKIGVKVSISSVSPGVFADVTARKQLPFFVFQDMPTQPDAAYAVNPYFRSNSSVNYNNYNNPKVDSLIKQALAISNPQQRLTLIHELQKLIVSDAPWVFLVEPGYHLAHRSTVKGATWYTIDSIRFGDYSIG